MAIVPGLGTVFAEWWGCCSGNVKRGDDNADAMRATAAGAGGSGGDDDDANAIRRRGSKVQSAVKMAA